MSTGRDILRHSRYARNEARELLQSIFVAEFIRPSRELWIVSPWLSDVEVVDDSAGAFASIVGATTGRALTLSAALVRLAESGTRVRVVTRPVVSDNFVNALRRRLAQSAHADSVTLRTVEALHTKGLVGDDYRVMGSMNFTFNGIQINDEAIQFDRNADAIARVRLEFEQNYGERRA
jgi:phosphatidylserine/phosphatidylglycerophosphate/cardiolipin synthase-like enzyme